MLGETLACASFLLPLASAIRNGERFAIDRVSRGFSPFECCFAAVIAACTKEFVALRGRINHARAASSSIRLAVAFT